MGHAVLLRLVVRKDVRRALAIAGVPTEVHAWSGGVES
jgi:hypothetical protein